MGVINKMMKAIILALLILTVSSGSRQPQNPETKWQSVNSIFRKHNNTKMSTKEVKLDIEKRISDNITRSSYHNLRTFLWSFLDPAHHVGASSMDSAVLEAIQLAMTSATQANKWEFYYMIWQVLFSSQVGATSSELDKRLPQMLFYLFQDSTSFFAFVEKLLKPLGVDWKVALRSIQSEVCYITSTMSRRSFSEHIRVFLAPSVKSNRSRMGTDAFNIQNILLNFIKKLHQVFFNELKPIWYFFGQNVFPLFESYIGRSTKQILLKLTDFILEQMLLSTSTIKLDVKGQCSQGNLNQLLIWSQ
ncbi:uncharacterized protein LOC122540885 [Chiloscyllium plagiosum]|uniref:uncharacterized protein LOC122540885 n=1 Tax=Chiloscyllium plagiosum TaxID=36176 RepID=UPI001CB8504C|nr:uncharacterized protein LOC122540885 [Chiloscyllium plagiosum]